MRRFWRRPRHSVYLTNLTTGRTTALRPGDTATIRHRVVVDDRDLHLDREYLVAEVRVEE